LEVLSEFWSLITKVKPTSNPELWLGIAGFDNLFAKAGYYAQINHYLLDLPYLGPKYSVSLTTSFQDFDGMHDLSGSSTAIENIILL
jgi:hypothetical protein